MITGFLVKTALAARLVPCGGSPPETVCDTQGEFIQLVTNVIDFAITKLAFPLVVLFFLIGGFLLLTSGGSPNRIEQGKKAITGAVIGLVIVLTSVVVIHTFFEVFVKPEVCDSTLGKGGLWSVKCPGAIE